MQLRRQRLRFVVAIAIALTQFTALPNRPVAASTASNHPSGPSPILFTGFQSAAAFAFGAREGTVVRAEHLALADGVKTGTWVSPLVDPGFHYTQLVASWNADTPSASSIRVEAQTTTENGQDTRWYVLGVWADGDEGVRRTSIDGQADADARVDTDTLVARGSPFAMYRLRVTLERASPDEPSPAVRMVGAVVSDGGSQFTGEASAPSLPRAIELPVPAYSQELHAGHYPQLDGGGARWCSPTSTQMVVAYWEAGPSPDELAWVAPGHVNPEVDYAARGTYDAGLRGTGNWPFNTAYAGRFGLSAFVTHLRSLTEAESFVRAGIPIVASLKPGVYGLDGYLFPGSAEGHLLVIIGFDETGDPIVNDPAAWSNATVRRIYDRMQFERAWLGGSGGIAYVIHRTDVALPRAAFGATRNW
jgi:hypothetical protein